ncbi:MAG: heme exporter protein CcmD [Aestuariivirgaceae bacterium]|jgi:heme exporter protein D
MDLAAPHLGFVLAAYGLTLLVLGGLVLWLRHRSRTLAAALQQLEAAGAPRRRPIAEAP